MSKYTKIINIFFFLILLMPTCAYSQIINEDSLWNQVDESIKYKDFERSLDPLILLLVNSWNTVGENDSNTIYIMNLLDNLTWENEQVVCELIYKNKIIESEILADKCLNIRATYLTNRLNLANAYTSIGFCYYQVKEFRHAFKYYSKADTIYSKLKDHDRLVTKLMLRNICYENGDINKSIEYAEAFLLNYKSNDTDADSLQMRTYNQLGHSYVEINLLHKAIENYKKALEISIKLYGEQNMQSKICYYNIATTFSDLGEINNSIYYMNKAISIQMNNKFNIEIYGILSQLYFKIGEFQKSETAINESMNLAKLLCEKQEDEYAFALNNYGHYLYSIGKFRESLTFTKEALNVFTITGNKSMINTCNFNIGSCYDELGDFSSALTYYDKVNYYLEENNLKDSEYGISYLNNLANTLLKFNDYLNSKLYCQECISICETIYPNLEFKKLDCLSTLGHVYYKQQEFELSIKTQRDIGQIMEKTIGKHSPIYIRHLINYSKVCMAGNYQKLSHDLILEAISLLKTKENNYRDLTFAYEALSEYEYYVGNLDKSVKYIDEAINYQNKYTNDNLSLIYLKNRKSIILNLIGKTEEAIQLKQSTNKILFDYTKSNLFAIGEDKIHEYLKGLYDNLNIYDSYLIDKNHINQNEKTNSLNNAITINGLLLSETKQFHEFLAKSTDTTIANLYKNYIISRNTLISIREKNIIQSKNDTNVEYYEKIYNKSLRQLSLLYRNISFEYLKLNLSYDELKTKLNSNQAIIIYNSINYFDNGFLTDSTLYTAYIIRSDQKEPEWVYLFEQKSLDSLFYEGEPEYVVNTLYQDQRLYQLVWKSLEPHLKGINEIYITPSGKLHQIAFSAISDSAGNPISDKYTLRQVTGAAQVVFPADPKFQSRGGNNFDSIALFGGIDYETNQKQLTPIVNQIKSATDTSLLALKPMNRSIKTDSTSRGITWNYLPGTLQEINEIHELFEKNKFATNAFSDKTALEEQFKALENEKAPTILHIATHGFFLPNPKLEKEKLSDMFLSMDDNKFSKSENPLLRSGLLFAGASNSWKNDTINLEIEDGILTALEVSNLNLQKTRLVVLSACETGLGDVKGREGVFGLQRGFKLAGVDYIIMSLWRIPDNETKDFMVRFYTHLLKENNIPQAFKNAQKEMRALFPSEPYKWAGLVLVE